MSMKVLDGYLHRGDLRDLLSAIGPFVEAARAACLDAVAAQYAAAGCDILDRVALGLRQEHDLEPHLRRGASALSAFGRAASESRKETLANGRRDVFHDWQCKVVVYPMADGPTPLRLLAEQRQVYRAAFEAIPGVEDCLYDGRTDGSPAFSEQTWQFRQALWDRVAKGGALTGEGMAVEAVPEEGYRADIARIVARQPSLAARATECARRIEMTAWMGARRAELGADADAHMQWAWKAYGEFERWARDGEGTAAIAARADTIAPVLPAAYSGDDLRKGVELPPRPEEGPTGPAP